MIWLELELEKYLENKCSFPEPLAYCIVDVLNVSFCAMLWELGRFVYKKTFGGNKSRDSIIK